MRTLAGSLPFLGTLLWSGYFYFRAAESCRSWRWALSLGCVLLGTLALTITELLSALHLLGFASVLVAWSLTVLLPVLLLGRFLPSISLEAELKKARGRLRALPPWILLFITVLAGLLLLMAVFSAPINYDTQSYHLPRQVYWLMQGSIGHFRATYPFQNSHPVLTEYLGLNLMILSGGDDWHNLVQAFFFAVLCGLVSLIAACVGSSARGQGLAVLFLMLVPVAFYEASNSKNDLVAAFFILIPLLVGIRLWTGARTAGPGLLLLAALSAGLGMATKGTAPAYLVAPAFLITMACLRQRRVRVLAYVLVPAILLGLMPMLPNVIRNARTFGSPSGPGTFMANGRHDPGSVLGVALKNVANQFACGSAEWIRGLENATASLLRAAAINPNDPMTNLGVAQLDGPNLRFLYFEGCEDVIPAPVQSALLLLLPLAFLRPTFRRDPGVLALGVVCASSFLLFCALFKWQPWGGRLLIPLFAMASPLVGKAEDFLKPRWLPILFTGLELLFLQHHVMGKGPRHLEGGDSIFALSKEAQMSACSSGGLREIRDVAECLRENGVHQVQVDGKDTPIYALLREVRKSLPALGIRSGHYSEPLGAEAIVEALGSSAEPDSACLEGYRTVFKGKYYRVYLLTP
jgi:hypothetical protein